MSGGRAAFLAEVQRELKDVQVSKRHGHSRHQQQQQQQQRSWEGKRAYPLVSMAHRPVLGSGFCCFEGVVYLVTSRTTGFFPCPSLSLSLPAPLPPPSSSRSPQPPVSCLEYSPAARQSWKSPDELPRPACKPPASAAETERCWSASPPPPPSPLPPSAC
eukprot:428995-Hanusia_phi.AAC.2